MTSTHLLKLSGTVTLHFSAGLHIYNAFNCIIILKGKAAVKTFVFYHDGQTELVINLFLSEGADSF